MSVDQAYEAFRAEVKRLGLMERAYGYYALYTFLSLSAVALGLFLVTVTPSLWVQIPNAIFLGIVFIQLGTLVHDLSHGQVFASRQLNRNVSTVFMGLVCGLSESKWYEKHNAHHETPNQIGHDPDLDVPFIFSAKQIPFSSPFFRKWILPYQHVLFFLVLPLIYLNMIIYGLRFIFHNFSLRTFVELCLMVIHFVVLFYIIFAYLPLGTGILFLAIVFLVNGLYMSLIFAPNHKGEDVLGPDEKETWVHQITLTRNLYPSQFIFHAFSGLNFQIEHHLFPNMPRINYFRLHPLVKQFCKEHNITYHETTFWGSLKEIYSALKEQAARA